MNIHLCDVCLFQEKTLTEAENSRKVSTTTPRAKVSSKPMELSEIFPRLQNRIQKIVTFQNVF